MHDFTYLVFNDLPISGECLKSSERRPDYEIWPECLGSVKTDFGYEKNLNAICMHCKMQMSIKCYS